MKKKKYDLFFSIGERCAATITLRGARLQFKSYPFDWVAGTKISDRANIIKTNFSYFINKDNLKYVNKYNEKTGAQSYLNTLTDMMFPHEFYENKPIEKFYNQVYEKYQRRIKRLDYRINNSNNVLVYYLSLPNSIPLKNEELIETQKIIQEKYPNTKIDLLYIENDDNIDIKSKKVVNITDNITKMIFSYKKPQEENAVNSKKIRFMLNNEFDITDKFLTPKNKMMKFLNKIKFTLRKPL